MPIIIQFFIIKWNWRNTDILYWSAFEEKGDVCGEVMDLGVVSCGDVGVWGVCVELLEDEVFWGELGCGIWSQIRSKRLTLDNLLFRNIKSF